MRAEPKKNILKDNLVFHPPCGLVNYVRFERGICPYSRCKSCGECLATDMDIEALEILKFNGFENIGIC